MTSAEWPVLDDETRAELLRFGAATLYEAAGQRGALSPDIKPVNGVPVVGPAMTVQAMPGDNLAVHLALEQLRGGEVVVVACGEGARSAIWGELTTASAQARGAVGLVTDGAVRDKHEIVASGFPVFASATSVVSSSKVFDGWINVPIVCGGAPIHPGDIVVGDDDGVVVLRRPQLRQVLAEAGRRRTREEEILADLRRGKSLLRLYTEASS